MTHHNVDQFEAVVELLCRSQNLLVITGAGISVDSGLPVYRGIGGLYERDDTEDGLAIEEVLSGPMFRTRPELTWKYLTEIGEAAQGATFNRGHSILAKWESQVQRLVTLTQNVDGFHRQAGSQNVIEIHGNFASLICPECDWQRATNELSALDFKGKVPRCPACDAVVRPPVVLFGEWLPESELNRMTLELERGFDLVFCIGTSSRFPYITAPVEWAIARGIPTVEINPSVTELSDQVDYCFATSATAVLAQLDALWNEQRSRDRS